LSFGCKKYSSIAVFVKDWICTAHVGAEIRSDWIVAVDHESCQIINLSQLYDELLHLEIVKSGDFFTAG